MSIKYRESRIEHLALYGSNVNAYEIFIFGFGLSGLGMMIELMKAPPTQ